MKAISVKQAWFIISMYIYINLIRAQGNSVIDHEIKQTKQFLFKVQEEHILLYSV